MFTTDLLRRKIGGIIFTLRTMGPYYLFREIIRRLFGIPYSYRGIKINSIETFRLINGLLYLSNDFGYDGYDYFIRTKYGIIYGKGPEDLYIVKEDLENEYLSLNARNNVVVDVGAYHGETTLMFLSWGAKIVYAYEPIPESYNYFIKAIKANGVEDKVKAFNYGWWFYDSILKVKMDFARTGSLPGDTEVRVVSSAKELLRISKEVGNDFVVKMDCEGCEFSLLAVPCEILKLAKQYVIEIHGASMPLIDKFINCDFEYELIKQFEEFKSIANFIRADNG